MTHQTPDGAETREDVLEPIRIPAIVPPTPAELERRRVLAERALQFRAAVGPIGCSTSELIRRGRDPFNILGGEMTRDRPTPDREGVYLTTIPRLELPPAEPPTPEELARRAELFERAMKIRAKIGPIGVPTDELVREGRSEEDR